MDIFGNVFDYDTETSVFGNVFIASEVVQIGPGKFCVGYVFLPGFTEAESYHPSFVSAQVCRSGFAQSNIF